MQFFAQYSDLANPEDDDSIQVAQANTHNDIKKDIMLLTPYGFWHRPMPNALIVAQNMLNDQSTITGMASDSNIRMKQLQPSEVVVGNGYATALIYFKEDGTIEVTSPWEVNVIAPTVNVNCTTLEATCTDATVNATTVTLNATNIALNGNVSITGSLEIDGVDFETHVHGNVQNGVGTTGVPQ